MNTQYRNHRYKLHKNYFLPHPTTEVAMQHPPPGVPQEDWNYLCSYFSSDEFKVLKLTIDTKQNQFSLYSFKKFLMEDTCSILM